MVPSILSTIVIEAVFELLGSVTTAALTNATKKLLQKLRTSKGQLQEDFNQALSVTMSRLEKEYDAHVRLFQFLNCIGQHYTSPEAHELFTEATSAYLFRNYWSRNHLPELLDRFAQNCTLPSSDYRWQQADEDFAEFFRHLEMELAQSGQDWRELLSYQRLREISSATFNLSSDTSQIVKHLEVLVAALAPPPPNINTLRNIYLNHLLNRFGEIDFRGIAQVKNIVKLPLRNIFIPLSGMLDTEENAIQKLQEFEKMEDIEGLARIQIEKQKRILLHQLVRENPYLVILGDPGSGKSTTLKYISLLFATNESESYVGLGSQYLPIFLPISAYAQALTQHNMMTLQSFIPKYYQERHSLPDFSILFNHAFENSYALVLLDGLDEVQNWEIRLAILRQVENDMLKSYPLNRFIFTSRLAGYDRARLGPPFRHCTVLPFNDDEVCRFVHQWSLAFEMAGVNKEADIQVQARQYSDSLIETIFAMPEVKRLAVNPLMITILALIHHQNVRLPERRVDLYKLCVQALAETWNKIRSENAIGCPLDLYLGNQRIDERLVVEILGPVALWMHETTSGGLVDRSDLRDQIAKYLPVESNNLISRKHAADDFLRIMVESCGLLQEKGENLFGFLHLTFEEYLAGRALMESESIDRDTWLQKNGNRENWKEVIRLAVGGAYSRDASNMLEKILTMPECNRAGYQALLAGECLLDLNFQVKAKQKVLQSLLAIFDAKEVGANYRVQAGEILNRLGDPRNLDELIEIPGGESLIGITESELIWIEQKYGKHSRKLFENALSQHVIDVPSFFVSKYPVTHRLFRDFVTSGGYHEIRWWGFSTEAERFRRSLKEKHPVSRLDPRWNVDNLPVLGVSWYEAVAFCNWLTYKWRNEGKLDQNECVRLPTEAEWEKAASWSWYKQIKLFFPWGNEYDDMLINFERMVERNLPVGAYPDDSPYGVRDMVNNIWEWCQSEYREYPYHFDYRENLSGQKFRILRGGVWSLYPVNTACAIRYFEGADMRDSAFGFRYVKKSK